MNSEKIGTAAGVLWTWLGDRGVGVTMTELKKVPGLTTDEAVTAVGWLAREGKLSFSVEGRKSLISLAVDEAPVL
jgi:hypothetical protein